jgi:hypothetical protein
MNSVLSHGAVDERDVLQLGHQKHGFDPTWHSVPVDVFSSSFPRRSG